jgi:uncharacterized protein YndB with AHSA1/START domain
MKWIFRVLGIIVALALCVVAMGAALPRQHVVSRQVMYHRPPEAIWQAIMDYEKFPSWIKGVARVETFKSPDGHPGWTEVLSSGMRIPLEITTQDPPRRLVTRIADPKLPWGGTWTTEITPVPGGSAMRITEDGYVNNPLFRFLSRFVFGYTDTLDSYMKSLGGKFGEQVAIQN